MGVYHLMGLGLSAGAVTGPLSFLAHRYERWSPADEAFFGDSGERKHREAGRRVGDVQGIVIFASREVIDRRMRRMLRDNGIGRTDGAESEEPVRDTVERCLASMWPKLAPGRTACPVHWCEVDPFDLRSTFERMARVVAALAGVGGQGKEMWANLTGGTNVMNLALQLAASLSGDVGRLYYVQVPPGTEPCLRYPGPDEDAYWIDVPTVPLGLAPLAEPVLDLLSAAGELSGADLFGRLVGEHVALLAGTDAGTFVRFHLAPLWKAGLVADVTASGNRRVPDPEKVFTVGSRWETVLPYLWALRDARAERRTFEQLETEPWLTCTTIGLP